MVNWESSFSTGDASRRSGGEPLSWHEAQAPVFATRLVANEKVCGWPELEKIRKHVKDTHDKAGEVFDVRAWQDLFDIEQILSRSEAVRLVPMR